MMGWKNSISQLAKTCYYGNDPTTIPNRKTPRKLILRGVFLLRGKDLGSYLRDLFLNNQLVLLGVTRVVGESKIIQTRSKPFHIHLFLTGLHFANNRLQALSL